MSDARPPSAVAVGETARMAFTLADSLVLSIVRLVPAERLQGSAHAWHDLRPLLSEQEYRAQSIDLHRVCIAYGHGRGLITHHPARWHLVRINHP